MPFLELHLIGDFVDALIGARGIGIWTSDITNFIWYQFTLIVLCIPALVFSNQISGTVKRLGILTSEIFLCVSLFFAALPVAPILLPIIVIVGFFASLLEKKILLLIYSLLILLLMQNSIAKLINVTIHRGATVGEALFWGGSFIALLGWLALRPYLYSTSVYPERG